MSYQNTACPSQRVLRWMPNVTQWLAALPKHEIRGPSLECTQLAWKWELTPPQHYPKPKRLKIPKTYRSNTAMMNNTKNNDTARDDHLEETDNIGVRDGGDELAKSGVLACHRTMVSTTPDVHSNSWGPVILPRQLRLTLHLSARHFLNASIASDAFDSTYQTHETTDGLQKTKNCKVHPNQLYQTEHHAFTTCSPACSPRVSTCLPLVHVFTTCSPRVYHVFTTCSPACSPRVSTCLPRVHHVFTTYSPACSPRVHHVFVHHVFVSPPRVHHVLPRVHHVFTTCTPRLHHVYHVYTTCSPRVALGLVNQVTERDEGVIDRDHISVHRHEARAFQCDRTT